MTRQTILLVNYLPARQLNHGNDYIAHLVEKGMPERVFVEIQIR